mmetsp:Transcript_25526/g.51879  ORF Transcript_25526/g.51879 Transcript_25526/m.51879 type:complete len:149 (+) Transcript_25526:231-677(+)
MQHQCHACSYTTEAHTIRSVPGSVLCSPWAPPVGCRFALVCCEDGEQMGVGLGQRQSAMALPACESLASTLHRITSESALLAGRVRYGFVVSAPSEKTAFKEQSLRPEWSEAFPALWAFLFEASDEEHARSPQGARGREQQKVAPPFE